MRFPNLRALALAAAVSLAPATAFAQTVYVVPAVRVSVAPPPIRVETIPAQPTAAHVWIPGHWVWRYGRHEWAYGHWVLPPEPGYVWEPARWVPENGQWVYYEGHWRHTAPPAPVVYQPAPVQTVVVDTAPPPPLVEVRPAAPFGGAVWIPGYWTWHGNRHFWVGGRWSAPWPGHVWEPHHWELIGGRWHFVPGHWR